MNQPETSPGNPSLPMAGIAAGPASNLRRALLFGLAGGLAVLAYVGFRSAQDRASLKSSQQRLVAQIGFTRPTSKRLAPGYLDADGTLVADSPRDPQKLVDPDEIVVAHYDGDEEDTERVDWNGFQILLSQATGKKVVCQPYLCTADEVAAFRGAKIHVLALHAADAPYMVNNTGFVPIAVLGSESSVSGNHLIIAAGPKSTIRSLADLRGRTLTCTRPDSITGYRAAIAVLSHEAGLVPDVDYHIHFSFGQKRSIRSLIAGEVEVAALSAEKLQSLLAEEEIASSDYRIIHESQVIPRLTIGHVYNLAPELAAKVTQCVLEFDNAGAAAAAGGKSMRFFAIDYRKDFAFARAMDDTFDPRIVHTINRTP